MAKYIARACPKCHDYLEVLVGESLNQLTVVPVIARCMRCDYRSNWKLITKRKPTRNACR